MRGIANAFRHREGGEGDRDGHQNPPNKQEEPQTVRSTPPFEITHRRKGAEGLSPSGE